MVQRKIVILDGHTVQDGDASWDALRSLGALTVFDRTDPAQVRSRLGDGEILLTSKCTIGADLLAQCPALRYVGSMATGYNNIDVAAAKRLGIAVTHIPAYSTEAVAQHTIALLLEVCNYVGLHNQSVQQGEWTQAEDFCYWKAPVVLLAGRSLGIVGYGRIGQRVGEIACALGMDVYVYSKDREKAMQADFLSLHCPLDEENRGFVDQAFLSRMKPGAVLINTARGALIDEDALAVALQSGQLRAAALDVLAQEPPQEGHPLIGLPNCVITPHMAWAPAEMRAIVRQTLADNLRSFLDGGTLNRVDL